jgi:membrane protein insertase Oxa1/YidC/SpoIIIJ
MLVWHMNIALKAISSHGSIWAALPFYVLIAVAVGTQYFQMSQLNRRNPNAAQMSGQMQTFQRLTPILFAYIYFIVPAAAVIYMVVSTLIRILTQDLIFRFDRPKPKAGVERSIPAVTEGDANDDAKSDGKVTPSSGSPNGSTAKPKGTQGKAAPAPRPAPGHPRAKDKRKRKAR